MILLRRLQSGVLALVLISTLFLTSSLALQGAVRPKRRFDSSYRDAFPRRAINKTTENHEIQLVTNSTNTTFAGYLGVFFLGADPKIYFYLSDGQNATSFSALNAGQPILIPTLGTGGVRDPSIVRACDNNTTRDKYYILGTDLDISKTDWSTAQRLGSRSILIWESEDLVFWTGERLVEVEDSAAGAVWAPKAVWDPDVRKYLVCWASNFFSDKAHMWENVINRIIRCAYTRDFIIFEPPRTFVNTSRPTIRHHTKHANVNSSSVRGSNVIDMVLLPLEQDRHGRALRGTKWLRFIKNESSESVYVEHSTTGLWGAWTRDGGEGAYIERNVEGPAAWLDNVDRGKVHLLLDYYGANGYAPFESLLPQSSAGWKKTIDRGGFPTGLRHGSVLPIREASMRQLTAQYG